MKITLTICAVLLGSLSASAQMPWVVGPSVNYGSGDAASTPASGVGHAAADLIRAQGTYNDLTASALVKFEDARHKYLENQRDWSDLYIARQRAITAAHNQAKEEARERNARIREEQLSQTLPPRLGTQELNPVTGDVAWPLALRRDTFALDRSDIEAVLASRAKEGLKPEIADALFDRTQEMRIDLRNQIRNLRTPEYLEARRFLDRLTLEAKIPIENTNVARSDELANR